MYAHSFTYSIQLFSHSSSFLSSPHQSNLSPHFTSVLNVSLIFLFTHTTSHSHIHPHHTTSSVHHINPSHLSVHHTTFSHHITSSVHRTPQDGHSCSECAAATQRPPTVAGDRCVLREGKLKLWRKEKNKKHIEMMALWYWFLFLFLCAGVHVEMMFEGIKHWCYDKVMIWEKYITTIDCELPNDVCKLKW